MKCNIFIAELQSLDFLYCYLQVFANKLFAPFFLCTVSSVAAATIAGLSRCCPAVTWADGIVKLCKLTSKSCDCAEGLAVCWVPPARRDGKLYYTRAGVYCGWPPRRSLRAHLCLYSAVLAWHAHPFLSL